MPRLPSSSSQDTMYAAMADSLGYALTRRDAGLRLVPTPEAHLAAMMTWFPTRRSCGQWGGPQFRFPFDSETFRADARYEELPSYSLVSEGGDECLGFGQYYRRVDRCHLARLVVAPAHRGRGLGSELIERLAQLGCAQLGVAACSLFVLSDNSAAVRLYERLGFRHADDPADATRLEGCLFMVRDNIQLAR